MDTNSRTTPAHRTLTQRTRLDVLGAVREFEQAIAEFKRWAVLPSIEPSQLVASLRLMQNGMDGLVKLINDGAPAPGEKCSGCGALLTERDRAKMAAAGPQAPNKCEFCK